jgi:hypothetical protein
MTHQQAIEPGQLELSANRTNYTTEQLFQGYTTLQTLIDEYLVLAGS